MTDSVNEESSSYSEVLIHEYRVSAQASKEHMSDAGEISGTEGVQRVAEAWDGFWDEGEVEATAPARSLSREEAEALGYVLSENYAPIERKRKSRKWGKMGWGNLGKQS